MSVNVLLKTSDRDLVGPEVVLRIVGSREPPAKMVIQIAVSGSAVVVLQGRIARDAPWQDIGEPHSASAIVHIDAIQFLGATASNVTPKSSVTVWAIWGW